MRPLFLYLPFEAVHGAASCAVEGGPPDCNDPTGDLLQAPQRYVDQQAHIPNVLRRTFAGMVGALDEAVLGLCEADGIHTAVETTGMTPWRRLRLIAAVTDLFLYDLKHSDEDAHRQYTGVSLEPILANLRNLLEMDAEVLVRVPVIPGCNGSPDTIRGIGRHALEAGAERISLLPFNPSASGKYSWLQREYPLEGVKRQGEDEMLFLEHLLRTDGLEVVRA